MILKSHHAILGVPANATKDEIKKAFRLLAHQHHPDKPTGNAEKFKEVSFAYSEMMKWAPETRGASSGFTAASSIKKDEYGWTTTYTTRAGFGWNSSGRDYQKAMDEIIRMYKEQEIRKDGLNQKWAKEMEDMMRNFSGDWSV